MNDPRLSAIIEEIKQGADRKVKVAITDIDGVLRGKYLHKEKFLGALTSGFGFCNVIFGWDSSDVCYDNAKYTGWHSGYPDAHATLDLSTFRRVPWDDNVPFFLGDFQDESGAPLHVCPRSLLRGVLARADERGYLVKAGMEFEFFNFRETPASLADKRYTAPAPISPQMFGYSVIRMGQNLPFLNALMDDLSAFGVPIEGLHTETGPGVLEAALLYSEALEAADRAMLFKTGAKEIGHRYGIMPSFIAKWNDKLPGCSGHTHLSLWSGQNNVFHDANAKFSMSDLMRSFVAGILRALPEILPMYAPTVNSYKRLVDGYWAPTRPTWGIDNRTVAVRVIPGSPKSTRIEVRVPGSDVNPYLAVAACVASGLWGVEQKLELLTPPAKGSAYADESAPRLPRNLHEAATRMGASDVARTLFGDGFVDHFVGTRIWEWRQFQDAVTDWEIRRYFEII